VSPAIQITLALGSVGVLLGLMAGVRRMARRLEIGAEVQRKLIHVATGLYALSLPWLFPDRWPVYVLIGVTLVVMLVLRLPNSRLGKTLHGVERQSYGDLLLARLRRALPVSRRRRPVSLRPAHRRPDPCRCRRGAGGEHVRYKVLPHRGWPEERGGKRRLLSHDAADLDRLPDADDTVAAAQHPRDLDDGRGFRNAGGGRKLARLRQPVPAAGPSDLPVGPCREQPGRASDPSPGFSSPAFSSSGASRRIGLNRHAAHVYVTAVFSCSR
jgi:hypothetical protein